MPKTVANTQHEDRTKDLKEQINKECRAFSRAMVIESDRVGHVKHGRREPSTTPYAPDKARAYVVGVLYPQEKDKIDQVFNAWNALMNEAMLAWKENRLSRRAFEQRLVDHLKVLEECRVGAVADAGERDHFTLSECVALLMIRLEEDGYAPLNILAAVKQELM